MKPPITEQNIKRLEGFVSDGLMVIVLALFVGMCISQYMQDEKERKRSAKDDQH